MFYSNPRTKSKLKETSCAAMAELESEVCGKIAKNWMKRTTAIKKAKGVHSVAIVFKPNSKYMKYMIKKGSCLIVFCWCGIILKLPFNPVTVPVE